MDFANACFRGEAWVTNMEAWLAPAGFVCLRMTASRFACASSTSSGSVIVPAVAVVIQLGSTGPLTRTEVRRPPAEITTAPSAQPEAAGGH